MHKWASLLLLFLVVVPFLSGCASKISDSPNNHLSDNQYQPLTNANPRNKLLTPVGVNVPTGLERAALNRFLHEMQVLESLLKEANAHQNPEQRIKFHYQNVHNDLSKIRDGVNEYLNARDSSPRDIKPISGDYRY